MGFWHTGYMDFHERTEGGSFASRKVQPPTFRCSICGITFSSEVDLRLHTFDGHPVQRPVLVLNGREAGSSRLTITRETSAHDWVIQNTDTVVVNRAHLAPAEAVQFLANQRAGVVDVRLGNGHVKLDFHFEFALSEEHDLDGVDAALDHFVGGGEMSSRAVDGFIMRCKQFPTGSHYYQGLTDYLYGVLNREADGESPHGGIVSDSAPYEGKYNRAVQVLGAFDRAPAEAICGIVAFHYNQFSRAMTKTKSQRVSKVSMRFLAMLGNEDWDRTDLAPSPHSSLDYALSDGVIEQVLDWSALPLDGTASPDDVNAMVASIGSQRPLDQVKLELIAAEHFLAVGDFDRAGDHAEQLRYARIAEDWYPDFRGRLQGASRQ